MSHVRLHEYQPEYANELTVNDGWMQILDGEHQQIRRQSSIMETVGSKPTDNELNEQILYIDGDEQPPERIRRLRNGKIWR